MPLVELPVPGTICPISAAVPAPIRAPVSGFIAWRVVSQGNTPPGHPARYCAGADVRRYLSRKKFDACPFASYCGCWCVNRSP